MKRTTALINTLKIRNRLIEWNGLIHTPSCGHEYFKIHKLWLFGSTLTKKIYVNDIDIVFHGSEVGKYREPHRENIKFAYLNRAQSSTNQALIELRRNIKMVRYQAFISQDEFNSEKKYRLKGHAKDDLEECYNNIENSKIEIFPGMSIEFSELLIDAGLIPESLKIKQN